VHRNKAINNTKFIAIPSLYNLVEWKGWRKIYSNSMLKGLISTPWIE
jgi:hypothetical protein